ncbi:hypothetical protein SLNWT_2768 [Streptomyces albus]|uniref:Uncharacterized protein n=1 Tax=Streptomyces albus (strain ATCC 21838 / DSM 41398 / FERM P-419 / JCM 4703 / NBRC 107858) TaxID=1081613 RepID=A0A0B5END9_STRA4|nr:hypothetical protein SLNWT_2768 [Streptomyces albus]
MPCPRRRLTVRRPIPRHRTTDRPPPASPRTTAPGKHRGANIRRMAEAPGRPRQQDLHSEPARRRLTGSRGSTARQGPDPFPGLAAPPLFDAPGRARTRPARDGRRDGRGHEYGQAHERSRDGTAPAGSPRPHRPDPTGPGLTRRSRTHPKSAYPHTQVPALHLSITSPEPNS